MKHCSQVKNLLGIHHFCFVGCIIYYFHLCVFVHSCLYPWLVLDFGDCIAQGRIACQRRWWYPFQELPLNISCLNFWDEAWWFLSLRVFGLLSSSLLLFPQRFSQYVFQPSSGVCRTREPMRNFERHPLLNPQGSPVLIPLAITGYKY